jgi:hypothetical protein
MLHVRVLRLLPVALFMAGAFERAAAQPPPPPPPPIAAPTTVRDVARPAEGTARVQGRVLSPDGQPVKRATVTLSTGSPGQQARTTTTDAEGRFAFERVAAGRPSLTASKVGYVTTGIGARRPGGPSRPIEIETGAALDNANITLARGCAIAGRVTDDYGDPVTGATVRVLKYSFTRGRRQLTQAVQSFDRTDDLGRFRVYGLPAGSYYVGGLVRAEVMNGAPVPSSGFAPTYYPGTANVAEAGRIACATGQDVAGIDFALSVVPTLGVSGTVRDSSGKAPASGFAMLTSLEDVSGLGASVGTGAQLKPDGSFVIGDVVPGDYLLRVVTSSAPEGEVALMPVTVSGPVAGLSVRTSKPGVASGRVVPDAGLSFDMPLNQVSISAVRSESLAPASGTGSTRANADGTFEIRGLHGPWMLRAIAPNWTLKAVRLAGTDVTDVPVAFRINANVSGLELVLTNRQSSLAGTVTGADGKPVRDYTLLLFAQDPAKWHWNSRFLLTTRPDQAGRFKVTSVPPGAYYVVAVRDADPEEWADPENLDRLKTSATKVTIAEGEAKTIDLPITIEEKR